MRNTLFLEENKSLDAQWRTALNKRHVGFAAAISLYQTAKPSQGERKSPSSGAHHRRSEVGDELCEVVPRPGPTQSYQTGSMDYLTAYSDMQSLDMEAKKTTSSYGPAAESYYQDTIKKELRQAEAKFSAQQKAGRSQFTSTAAQYDWGGPIDNFGSYGDGADHGMIRAQRGEFMVEQQQANTHAGALTAINSGATHADMARYYGAESTTMPAQTQSSWGGDIHVHALDAKSGVQWLMSNKHVIRSAVNASYAENSGGADA